MKIELEEFEKIIMYHTKHLLGEKDGNRAILKNIELYAVNLIGKNLKGIDFENAILKRSLLCGANLEGASFKGANLKKSILEGANLKDASLENAILKGVNLSRANLQGTNFLNADLENIDLDDSYYDESTTWPENFDPKLHGAIFVDEYGARSLTNATTQSQSPCG